MSHFQNLTTLALNQKSDSVSFSKCARTSAETESDPVTFSEIKTTPHLSPCQVLSHFQK